MSRFDNVGLFWQDLPQERRTGANIVRTRPPIPDTGWELPKDFPRLESASMLCIDVETNDTGLQNGQGPGEFRDDGFLAGIAVGVPEGQSWYFPMRHECGENLDPEAVIKWAKDELCRPEQPKLGANLLYDLGWLWQEGIEVVGACHDVQIAEPLLDEHAISYGLGILGQKYVGEGKDEALLYDWLARGYGGKPTRRQQAGRIHLAPPCIVGPYAQSDVTLPFKIFEKQKKLLAEQGLWELYLLECRLLPMLLAMRRRGVKVDMEQAQDVHEKLQERIAQDQLQLNDLVGFDVNVDAGSDLERVFKKLDLECKYTEKGNVSFVKDFLVNHEHPVTDMIMNVRKWKKFDGTFVNGYMFDHNIGGRIHCSFHALRNDDNGTISGRFSSSNPNLQNIPSRDKELGPLIRGLFIPEDGCYWEKDDYSQIEYRLFLHYAEGEEAERVREQFRKDPKTDYHALVAKWSKLDRKPAKNLNFGVIYGIGKEHTAITNGWTMAQAELFLAQYHERIPFAKPLLEKVGQVAGHRGYVKTILGRRSRFIFYEPQKYPPRGQRWQALPYEAAQKEWPGERLKRAFTYAALNRVLQGGAADMMKKAMVDIWESGICSEIGVPHLTVHDELDWSVHPDHRERMRDVKRMMEQAITLKLPVICDQETGPDWGHVR